jgi:hypothetical protein
MGKYADHYLIEYKDTIRLHFDTKVETAWLTLKNYGVVFGAGARSRLTKDVRVVTVGTPAVEPYTDTISIGQMLDATDVIKLQVGILDIVKDFDATSFECNDLLDVIALALSELEPKPPRPYSFAIESTLPSPYKRLKSVRDWLEKILNKAPGAAMIAKGIREWKEAPVTPKGNLDLEDWREARRKYVGFTAYFPEPNLIRQEERTEKTTGGKTKRHDTRDIRPIPCNMDHPPTWEFEHALAKIEAGLPEKAEAWRRKNPGKKLPEHLSHHAAFKRVSCFAFRGEKRAPDEIKQSDDKKTGGMLAGVTRTDNAAFYTEEVDPEGNLTLVPRTMAVGDLNVTLKEAEAELDETLRTITSAFEPTSPDPEPQTIDPGYLEAIKRFDIMHLGKFVEIQRFKAYVSTTRSTAISKAFANFYSAEIYDEKEDLTTYCYAVRCRGGFFLDSYVPPEYNNKDNLEKYLKSLHQFNSVCEQEVAVPGAIWWENIVGMRIIRCNKDGQFFFGPVFLKKELLSTDSHAFSELFELFSGRSQGTPYLSNEIGRSYAQDKFTYFNGTPVSNSCISISPISVRKPMVQISETALFFSSQPVSLSGAPQEVVIHNPGDGPLTVRSIVVKGQNAEDFVLVDMVDITVMAGTSLNFYVRFNPSSGGERRGVIEISHSASETPHRITLEGFGVPPVTFSPTELEFKEQLIRTTSDPHIVWLINRGARALEECRMTVDTPFTCAVKPPIGPYDPRELGSLLRVGPGQKLRIEVGFFPVRSSYEIASYLTITSKDGASYKLKVQGKAASKVRRNIDLSAKSLEFGNQRVDTDSRPKFGTLTNLGNERVEIDEIEVLPKDSRDFAVYSTSEEELYADAGRARIVGVIFTPTRAGIRRGKLKITYKAHYSSHEILLSGNGIDTETT